MFHENVPQKNPSISETPEPETDARLEKFVMENHNENLDGSRKRVIDILEIVKEDPNAIQLIHSVLKSVFGYIETIYNAEIAIQIARYRLEGDAFREHCESLDQRRKMAHDALLSSVKACNRYLFENYEERVPNGGICAIDPVTVQTNQRLAIGDWAIELEYEFLKNRKK